MNSKSPPFSRRDFLATTAAAFAASAARPLFAQSQPPKKVGFALVGIGSLTKGQLLPAFAKTTLCKPVAFVTGHPTETTPLAAAHGIDPKNIYTYDTFEKIKDNPDIDVVYVVLPNSLHMQYTLRAAQAGKHVLCEKPMANTPQDCQTMIDACKAAGRKLMIGYRMQYLDLTGKAIETARSQTDIGAIKQIQAECGSNRLNDDPATTWRVNQPISGGGALMDMGIYALQSVRYLSGEEPTELSAFTMTTPGIKAFSNIEETISISLKFKSNLLATVVSSYGYSSNRTRLYGSRGILDLDPLMSYSNDRLYLVKGSQRTEIPTTPQDHFATEMDHFADCVLNNKDPKTPGEEGLRDMKIITAAYESARSGKVIKLA